MQHRLAAALTLAAGLAAVAPQGAFAASKIFVPRSYPVDCWVNELYGFRNNLDRTIPRGTRVTFIFVARVGTRTYGLRRTETTKEETKPGFYHFWFNPPAGTKFSRNCSASVELLPDVRR